MTGSALNIPAFSKPSPDLFFLASEEAIYEYSILYGFAKKLHNEVSHFTFSEEKPLLIISESSDKVVFLIAAAFLLKIPVLILHPESTDDDILNIMEQVQPEYCFTSQGKRLENLTSTQKINIPDQWLQIEADWDEKLFTLNEPEAVAGLFLTSGSTDVPKIVPIKRRQILFAVQSSAENFKPGKNRYWLLCLPLNHIGGIAIIYRCLLYNSGIFRMDHFDVEQVRIFLSENKLFEVASLVPTMLLRILEDSLFQIHSAFKAVLLGGGPVTIDLLDYATTRGIPVVSSYGMTETCAQIAANPMLRPSGIYHPKTSVGHIFKPNEVEIRDEAGNKLPKIEEGLIWLKGPQIFDGYLNPELNKEAFDEDGWFNTGDYGYLNRNRQLFIKTRRTDLIITGGENVNPHTVEEAMNQLSDISECAVFGVEDIKWGQKIVAFIVSSQEVVDVEIIRPQLKKSLRGFQIPKEFYTVKKLPKSALGKIKRNKLQELYRKITEA
jgi:o-succinylbenzoate---CoA ligase